MAQRPRFDAMSIILARFSTYWQTRVCYVEGHGRVMADAPSHDQERQG